MIHFDYTPTWTSQFLWTVIVAFVFSFAFSYLMGANDCANAWSTSVASGVVKLWQAYILASIFNTLGAVLVGYRVVDTIRDGIFELDTYDVYAEYNATDNRYDKVRNCSSSTKETVVVGFSQKFPHPMCAEYTSVEYMFGELSAITGGTLWKTLAIIVRMPVSATHTIVGASLGFSLVLKGSHGIRWIQVIDIVVSWVVSPVLAGAISSSIYLVIKFGVMRRDDPFESALDAVPLFLWFMIVVIVFGVLFNGSKYLGFDKLSWWLVLLIGLAIGAIVAAIVHFVLRNWMRNRAIRLVEEDRRMKEKLDNAVGPEVTVELGTLSNEAAINVSGAATTNTVVVMSTIDDGKKVLRPAPGFDCRLRLRQLYAPTREHLLAQKVFYILQVVSACFLQFSHGSNDTANGVAPLVGIWQTFKTGDAESEFSTQTDIILFMIFGAISQVIGISTLGYRVMRTVGKDITEVSAPSGFAVELGAAFTVLLAARLGIPVSTTHCTVGAVVFVGIVRNGGRGVVWKVFLKCILTWVITLPASGLFAALIVYLLAHFILGTV